MSKEDVNVTTKPASKALITPTDSVFELVDNTSDETYFPMGLFVTLEAALDVIREKEEPPTDDPEEFVRLEVRERKVGKLTWWDNGKTVATIEWFADYSEKLDDWIWAPQELETVGADDLVDKQFLALQCFGKGAGWSGVFESQVSELRQSPERLL